MLSVALGNWFWVIPPDVVCAACNNGVLSVLDTRLQEHPFVAMVRTLADIGGRQGQLPAVGASNLTMRRDEARTLHIATNHERHVSRSEDSVSATPKWTNFGPRQRRVTARALMKTGLGVLWLARGPDETCRQSYDHVREAIRGIGDIPLQYGFGNSALPGHALQIMTISAESTPGLRVDFDYFGIKPWAQSAGRRDEASARFLEREIDVEFAENALPSRTAIDLPVASRRGRPDP